jgi:hypothetical protein
MHICSSPLFSFFPLSHSEGLKEIAEHGSTRQLERELKEEVTKSERDLNS